jgi:hypothetical protein
MADIVSADPDLHLVVDGRRILPFDRIGSQYFFRLARPSRNIQLLSRAGVANASRLNGDDRPLGYAVQHLAAAAANGSVALRLDTEELLDGFYAYEQDGWRWTTGHATLPADLLDGLAGEITLTVTGFGLPDYGATDHGFEATKRLLLGFRSFGDNCEFGIFQAQFKAGGHNLFQWASTTIDQLVAGLDARFEGLGDPAQCAFMWNENAAEYLLHDHRYLTAHTSVRARCADAAHEAELKERACARLALLCRKLLADIAAGHSIFVFKTSDVAMGETAFRRLHAALCAINHNSLLCVRLAGISDKPGTVEDAGNGLMIATIDRYVAEAGPYDMWLRICKQAQAIARAHVHEGMRARA